MATFYLDFENGNDANDGTTFANRWKTLANGATAARIAPGDEIRIMGSPAPTSLGQNGVWTSQALQGTKAITGATNATPISITCTAHGYSTGDTVVVESVTNNTNANGTWEITVTGTNTFTLNGSVGNGVGSVGTVRLRNNTRVMLTTAVTQNIASTGPGRGTWTASTNVTTSFNVGGGKEHRSADRIDIAAGFTTGLAAYWALPSTLDLSGYQQVSFWIRQNSGTIGAAGAVDLRLCSDTLGATAVNTISIPNLAVTGRWMPVTVDLATNLGSSIQSIAFYVNTDNGAQQFDLNNIIACKASSEPDSLTLTSLIGKNTTGETFWGIQSINGRRVMLDADTNALPVSSSVRGYYGTSETVTTWKRETIKLGPAASAATALQTIQDSGTDGSPITFSGGWDRTNMTTQNLETWLDGVNGNGMCIAIPGRSWLVLRKLSFTRLYQAIDLGGSSDFNVYTLGAISNLTLGAFNWGSTTRGTDIEIDHIVATSAGAVQKFTSTLVNGILKINRGVLSNSGIGIEVQLGKYQVNGVIGQTVIANNSSAAFSQSGCELSVKNCRTVDNSAGISSAQGAQIYLTNCTIDDSTEVNVSAFSDFSVQSHNHDNVAGNHKIFGDGYLISAATDQRKTASGVSWKIQPTNSTRIASPRPVILPLAKVACAANSLVTVKAWMYRDNSGLTMRLVCKGGQIAGVANDVVASVTTTNAWEEETITFTPTETGVVEITAEAWGGTTFSGWVDDMTITQA